MARAAWQERCRHHKVPSATTFSLIKHLSDPVRVRDWQIWGLPTDLVVAVLDAYMPIPVGMEPPFSAGQAIRAARLSIKAGMGARLGEPFRDRLSEDEHADMARWSQWLDEQVES